MSTSINVISGGLDVTTIVDNLIQIDSAPITQMQHQVATFQSKVSAFQSLNTQLSALSDKLNTILFGTTEAPLNPPSSYSDRLAGSIFSKSSVTSSDTSAISATATNPTPGNYSITVSNLAQAQSSASSNFSSTSAAAVGTGTLVIKIGTNSVPVTIDSTDNSLAGVRDAINQANAGVTANIVNDGTANPYRLVLTANNSGTANAFTIDESGLAGGQALAFGNPVQLAHDAQFTINGISVTKSSNSVSDVIDGVTFNLKQQTTAPVTLTVGQDTDSIVSALQDLISAYNSVNSFINGQFAYNSTTNTAGVLSGDSTLRDIQTNLQNQIIQSISNRLTPDNVLSQVGIDFNKDGSLTLDEAQLQSALDANPQAVAALFLGDGTSAGGHNTTDNRVSYIGQTSATQPGTYAVNVTGLAQQATITGSQVVTNLAQDETLTIGSGASQAIVSLHQNQSLADVLSDINAAFTAQGIAAKATDDGTGRLKIATIGYGSSQNLTVQSSVDASGSAGFQTTPVTATGADIAGTINGNAGVGSGLTLTGAAGQPEEGLSLNIAQTTTGDYGSVTIAPALQDVEGASILMNLHTVLNGITDPLSGPIQNSTDSLNQAISATNDEISRYQDRLDIERTLLTNEYSQADQALRMLTVTQASLQSQLASLSSSA